MKVALILTAVVWAMLLGGCADESLRTDEDYRNSKGPAPFSPDYTGVLPDPSTGRRAGGF